MGDIISLYQLYAWGVKLFICGKPATPAMVAEHIVREDEIYMPDFYFNDKGDLSEIRYDKITDR